MTDTNTAETAKADEAKKKLESGAAHAKAVLEKTTDSAKQVAETFKKHGKEVIDTGKEHLGAAGKDLGDAAAATVEDLRGQARTMIDQAATRAKNFQAEAEDYIRGNPLQAIGIAFAAGLLFGLISRR